MESQNGEHVASSNLLKAQSHVWNHIFNFINSMSLKCVVDLGIPDIIHNYGKPMSLSKLISSLPIHPSKRPFIYRLMRIMTHSGFFSQQNVTANELEIEYMLTDASILLLKDNPMSVTPFVQAMLDPVLSNPWHQLSTWFKSDDPTPFKTAHGMLVWDYAAHEPNFNNLFNDAMASDARLVTSVVIEKCKGVFNGLESLVDVGGGTGTMAKALAKSFPKMECIVFDLPHVVDGFQGSENLKYVGGDMFKEIPPADAILLKWILHDWNDEECVKILKKCKESLKQKGKEGKVIIIDMVLEIDHKGDITKSTETQLFFDMMMMVLVTGKERNEKEWSNLIYSAGFGGYKITPILGLRSMIEIYP
ncbi:trans-resveratrol di-O-methyltransferase-like [Trifolium pratense]|uniref:trans-resveratrol di-O-methyltransferase-like n=1 Tax=Trifolium pratense TaxID=57577 RepID=UPI001E69617A|nr:trans-resveratrol di-O-methyltransferase-like [Trifolium pratense]